MSDIKNKLNASMGALSGLKSKNDKQENDNNNQNNNQNNNRNHNNNDKSLEQRIEDVKIKGKAKRKIKNVTFGLYEDQQQSLKEIAEANELALNEFMRESIDMIIDMFNDKLEN